MRIDAGRCARIYDVVDGRLCTVAVEVDGRTVALHGPEVAVTVRGRRWTGTDLEPSAVEHHEGRLSWTLTAPDGALSVAMVVEADAGAGVVRKWAEISGRGRLERVELDRWDGLTAAGPAGTGEPVPYNAGPVGLGQPLFGDGFFAGVLTPRPARPAPVPGAARALPIAADRGAGPSRTPAAVLGAGGLDDFWDYVDTLRPVPPRLVTLSNNWYHLGAPVTMDEASVRAEVDGFAGVAERQRDVLALFGERRLLGGGCGGGVGRTP